MTTAIILAAGHGTRMRSARPKALQPLAGRPMLHQLIESAAALFTRIVVVIGPDSPELAAAAAPHTVVIQQARLGTAHAALAAADHFGSGRVAVLYADNPLIRTETLHALLAAGSDADLTLLAMRPPDPGQYGRVITDASGRVLRIVEYAEADPAERAIGLCNAGVFSADAARLAAWLAQITPAPRGEYYLTELPRFATRCRAVEAPWTELRGINSRAELAAAEAEIQTRLRARAMEGGATLTAPETVFLAYDTRLAADVTIGPHVVFGPGVSVGAGAEIRAFSHLEGCTIGAEARIGPYARLRPGTQVEAGAQVGNFVELKAARLGQAAKVNHLSYLGDADVGAGANIGAGTITCNYDGIAKHRTEIGAEAFIGSNATLVAPVTLGQGAFVAAGSTITDDVAPDGLAFGRARQEVKPGAASRLRAWLTDRAKRGRS